jgi:hypothetical protein
MNKLILDVEQTETDWGGTHVKVTHAPTKMEVAAVCTEEEIDELTDCLIQEVTEMVNICDNWLH